MYAVGRHRATEACHIRYFFMSLKNINYELLLNRAIRGVVKWALEYVVNDCLPGKHHFYISFLTQFNGVKLSEKMLKKYPQEMTIVLEDQFMDLIVEEDRFSVTLFFNDTKENICVPYKALTHFTDPSANIELKFTFMEGSNDLKNEPIINLASKMAIQMPSNVISLDEFKKSRDKK